MEEIEIMERLTKMEERSKSNTHRLDRLERVTNEIHTMSNTMIQLVEEVKHTNETVGSLDAKVERMGSRVDSMEKLPADDIRAYRRTAVAAIISAMAGIRAVKTMAQTAVSMLTVGQAVIEVNWVNVASVSLVAGAISILTSLAGLPEQGQEGGAA